MSLRTALCDVLGIELPIVQAPIASSPELAAAVSNAGGFGMLQGSWLSPKRLRETVRATRELTDRPFGVNLALEWPQEERLDAVLEEGVPAVSLFWGDPSPLAGRVHDAGATLICTVGSAAEAHSVVEAGADVVVAQGWESGGHVWGQVALFPLVPCVVDAVSPVPVVAAGGVADGRGLAAALALGAAGVWVGTRFVASDEIPLMPFYKDRVLEASETDTVYGIVFDIDWPDAPHRALRNSTVRRWEEAGRPRPGERPGEGEVVAAWPSGDPILRYSDALPKPGMTGDLEALALYAGQSAGLVKDVRPAGEIVRSLAAEAERILSGLATD